MYIKKGLDKFDYIPMGLMDLTVENCIKTLLRSEWICMDKHHPVALLKIISEQITRYNTSSLHGGRTTVSFYANKHETVPLPIYPPM